MKLAIVGGGVMGEAILTGALRHGVVSPADIVVAEVVGARRAALAAGHGVAVTEDASEAMAGAEAVLLAVKPQDIGTVRGVLHPDAVLISILAGTTIATLRESLGHDRIVRVMPNTPAAIGQGMSAWTATPAVTAAQRELVRGLLRAIGDELDFDDEKKIDMATAINGSGPAYVFLFIEAMVEAGVAIGLTWSQAERLVLQTVAGSGAFAQASPDSAATLRGRVTSPAGTTAAALLELEKGAFRATIIEAVRAAHRRAVELGEQ